MPITITSEINPILHCVFGDNGLLQCRIGLISEVIVIGIVNPMPLFPSLFSQSYISSHFFPKGFCTCYISFIVTDMTTSCTSHYQQYIYIHCHTRHQWVDSISTSIAREQENEVIRRGRNGRL